MVTNNIKNKINELLEEKNKVLGDLKTSMNDVSFFSNEQKNSSMVANINFLNTTLKNKVQEFEKINTSLLKEIDNLNEENSEKQNKLKELKRTYESNKNLTSGIEVALKDSNKLYGSMLKNIALKTTVLIGLYYYIYKA
jgi:predicted RNase H-like nuclease (RuvC/YqgF family)